MLAFVASLALGLSASPAMLIAGLDQAASPPPAAQAAPTDAERLICRREVPVGSLIASRKVCLTKAQWEARTRNGRDTAQRMVEENQGRPPGN